MKNTMIRKFISAMMAIVMVSCLFGSASAATTIIEKATPMADKLYEYGLFAGTGTDSNGKPIYSLENTATRVEGITMLVRLIERDAEADRNADRYVTKFTDVPSWAKGYVCYAYSDGLTTGTGATTFSPYNKITPAEYLTLVLRALGYGNEDFAWDKAAQFASEVGLIKDSEYRDNAATFIRADMVYISYQALSTKMKGMNKKTLGDNLGIHDNDTSYESLGKVVARTIDAGDPDNLLPASDGNYYLETTSIPDGTAITRDDLVYTIGASTGANLDNFTSILAEIDPGIKMTSKGLTLGGKVMCDVYVKDGFWKVAQRNWLSGSTKRNFTLTSMHYFGEADMAKAVYGMVDEHYRFRTDKTIPMSNELAAKYGLTILQDINSGGNTQVMEVSNGSSTWKVMYHTEDATGYLSPSCTISIPIRGLAEAESFELANAA